jgi:carboxyl-terminal processing protease
MLPLLLVRYRVIHTMIQLPRCFRRQWSVLALTVGVMAALAGGLPAAAASSPLLKQARAGQFEQVLEQLQTGPDGQRSKQVQALIEDLQRFQSNKQERLAQQRKAYEEALQTVATDLKHDMIEDALVNAINAREVAPDSTALMNDDDIEAAVRRGEQAAKDAVANEQWVEALSHYRLLDTLFEKQGRYREPLERVRRHVRVLQMYAPEVLQQLQDAYAKRQEEAAAATQPDEQNADAKGEEQADAEGDALDDDPAANLNFTSWKKRLNGVRPTMLRQALRYAARQHVSGKNYVPLMRGAVHGLEVLLETESLAKTFPVFDNKADLKAFRRHLTDLTLQLNKPGASLNYHEATSMVDGLLAMNRQTLDLPTRVVVYELTDGAMSRLDDFSSVIWPEDLSQFSRSTKGNFTGVGIQITRRDGELVVVTPLPNTPAYQAGIRAGDVIATVDGEDASQWSLNRAVNEITGPEGSEVTLGIDREGKKELLKFDIKRAEIEIESVRGWRHTPDGDWDYWIDESAGIGYVRLSQFIPQTAGDLDKAVNKLQQSGQINGLILDLRYNPGGLLSSAVDVADRFLKDGAIVSTVDGQGNRNTKSSAKQRDTYSRFPVVVLVNDASASASEIVSGALQDHGRALVIGQRTFGKGSVQDLYPLVRRQAYLKLTTQYYALPDGKIIHRQPGDQTWGIEPDLTVPMTNEQRTDAMEMRQKADVLRQKNAKPKPETERVEASQLLVEGVDPQLDSALLYLKTRLVADDLAIAQGPNRDQATQ